MRRIAFSLQQRGKIQPWRLFPYNSAPYFNKIPQSGAYLSCSSSNFCSCSVNCSSIPPQPSPHSDFPLVESSQVSQLTTDSVRNVNDSPILASEALNFLIQTLSSNLTPTTPNPSTSSSNFTVKNAIWEKIRRPWEGNCQIPEIMKVLELLPLLSVQQRSKILPKLSEQLKKYSSNLEEECTSLTLPLASSSSPSPTPSPSLSLQELCLGLSGLRSTHSLPSDLINFFTNQLQIITLKNNFTQSDANSLGVAISGLRFLKGDDPASHLLITQLSSALELALASTAMMDSKEVVMDPDIICRALRGLENVQSDQPAVRLLIKLLGEQLREPSRTGRALQLVSSTTPKQQKIVKQTLSIKPLTGRQIEFAAHGLTGLSSTHSECRALVGSLAGRLQTMRGDKGILVEPLTAAAAVELLSRLRHMDAKELVVKKFLQRILSHLTCRESVKPLSPSEISLALSGLRRMTCEDTVVQRIIDELILNRIPDQHWSAFDICRGLSGLKSMNGTTGEMKRLLQFLCGEMRFIQNGRLKRNKSTLTTSNLHEKDLIYSFEMIYDAMIGLSSMSSNSHEVQTIVSNLGDELKEILPDLLKSDVDNHSKILYSIGVMIGSMSSMCSHHDSIRSLIKTLCVSLPKLSPTAIQNLPISTGKDEWFTNLIYGLKFMDSDHYEVRSLIRGLTPHLTLLLEDENSIPSFNPFHIVKMLSGLRGLSNDAFSGIQIMDGSGSSGRGGHVGRGEPVCDLLEVCVKAVRKCDVPLSYSKLCGSLYGLQNMQSGPTGHTSHSKDLIHLISSLEAKLSPEDRAGTTTRSISVGDCCKGLYGLLDVADLASETILSIKLTLISQLITKASHSLTSNDRIEVDRIVNFYTHRPKWLTSFLISQQFQELQEKLQEKKIKSIVFTATPNTAETPPHLIKKGKFSELESSFFQDMTQMFGMELHLLGCTTASPPTDPLAPLIRRLRTMNSSLHFKLKQNETLFGFESDFILLIFERTSSESDNNTLNTHNTHLLPQHQLQQNLVGVINIEIDGPTHVPRHKQRFSSLRDRYLRQYYLENEKSIHLFEIYRISIPDTRGDFSRLKRKSLLSEVVFQDLVQRLEKRYSSGGEKS